MPELTPELRAALEKVPDEWTTWRDLPITRDAAVDLHIAKLIEYRHTVFTPESLRRTPAGRAALLGPDNK
jgi:hypothetical protein